MPLKSHPKVASTQVGYRSAIANTNRNVNILGAVASPQRGVEGGVGHNPPLRTTRRQLQRIIRDILYNDFFKFNVHSKLQINQKSSTSSEFSAVPTSGQIGLPSRDPLRTTSSHLQCVIRNILYNFFKFNVHRRLQVG